MTKIVRGLYATDMMTVNRPRSQASDAKPCGCGGHDHKPATDGSLGTALDRALAPMTEAHVLATAALAHYGITGDSGKMTGFAAKARALWAR